MIHIKVPATSANMGPGFDSIGIALKLYNHIWVEEISKELGLKIDIKREQSISIPRDETNLIYKTMVYFYEQKGLTMPGVHLIQEDFIPMVRGLGSSAACIVGGLLAANELSGRICQKEELAQMAAKLEGHPDNSNPAIFGSMVVGAQTQEEMNYVRLDLPEDLVFATMIPNFPVSTNAARKVLPETYAREDMVFNASRTALLVASIMTKKYENLPMAIEDRVHQSYRSQLIPNMEDIFSKAKELNALACYLSGAGSTLMAIVKKEKKELFQQEMSVYLNTLPNGWELMILEPELIGTIIESI